MRIKRRIRMSMATVMVTMLTCWPWLPCSFGFRIGVIGGGASGMFAAAQAARRLRELEISHKDSNKVEVVVMEGSRELMSKVTISGGGRCNVLHDTTKSVPEILGGYPRGSRELNGLMTKRFSPINAQQWFLDRGVTLKTENDGRMFPITDSSQTIVRAIRDAASHFGVSVSTNFKVDSISLLSQQKERTKFRVESKSSSQIFDSIILATGSSKSGHQFASQLGHTIVKPVPSLFTLNAKHQVKDPSGIFHGLSGLSLSNARLTLNFSVPGKKKKQTVQQEGPLLITHNGISGPATLRLSAFAARELHNLRYDTQILLHLAPQFGNSDQIQSILWSATTLSPKRTIASSCPLLLPSDNTTALPKRLWAALVLHSGFDTHTTWAEAPKKKVAKLSNFIAQFPLQVTGKGTFKDEFVTAGGVALREIDMTCMESKKCPNLFFCGEVIDVDGVTGGYNFMNCWSTGFVAGTNAAESVFHLTS